MLPGYSLWASKGYHRKSHDADFSTSCQLAKLLRNAPREGLEACLSRHSRHNLAKLLRRKLSRFDPLRIARIWAIRCEFVRWRPG